MTIGGYTFLSMDPFGFDWIGCVDPTYVWPQYSQYTPDVPGAQMTNVMDTIQHLTLSPSHPASSSEETSPRKVAKVLILLNRSS